MVGSPSTDALDRIVRGQADRSLTYAEVGASLGLLPAGYRHVHRTKSFNVGDFGAVRDRLRRWSTHRAAGVRLVPASPRVAEGTVLAQAIRLGPLTAIACCRIVRVIDEDDRYGFAYGTLPAHPECGEEAFVVQRDGAGASVAITAFSRPRHVLSRLGGPVARLVQDRITDRYLVGLIAH